MTIDGYATGLIVESHDQVRKDFEQLVEPTGLDVSFNCLIETVSF